MSSRLLISLVAAAFLAAPVAPARSKTPDAPVAPAAPAGPAAPAESDWRVPDPQNVLVIETNKGRIIVELNPIAAPNTVDRVRQLARQGFYDGRAFFRVLDNFMDQTGDPLDSGLGQSSLPNLDPEFTFRRGQDTPFTRAVRTGGLEEGYLGSLPVASQTMDLGLLTIDHKVDAWGEYCAGVLGMARADDPASGNSQYFLMRTNAAAADHATHTLDKNYTAFGRVLDGQAVVDSIKVGEPVEAPQDKVLSVKVLADLPDATRPKIRVIDPASPWFKAEASRLADQIGPGMTACSIQLPVEVK